MNNPTYHLIGKVSTIFPPHRDSQASKTKFGVLRTMETRSMGLGDLGIFPDDLLCFVLETLDVRSLLTLSCVSKLLRIFCLEEPLWQAVALRMCSDGLHWSGSWKKTAMQMHCEMYVMMVIGLICWNSWCFRV